MARDKRDEVHIDDNFAMIDVAMAMRRLTSLKLLLYWLLVLQMDLAARHYWLCLSVYLSVCLLFWP